MIRWLAHVLGLDNASGEWYLFWSGFAGDLGFLGAGYAIMRRHNCHQKRCLRIGRHPHPDHPEWFLCARHHPVGAPSKGDVNGGR